MKYSAGQGLISDIKAILLHNFIHKDEFKAARQTVWILIS